MEVRERLYTADEFWALADQLPDDKQFELIEGEIVEVPSSSLENAYIATEIAALLREYVKLHRLGRVFGADGGYTLNPRNMRIPDVSFVSKERMPEITSNREIFAPDLAVEVISASETPPRIHKKTALYLQSGVRQVWNVYPEEKVVEVWWLSVGGEITYKSLGMEEQLEGGDIVPGFTLPIAAIFNLTI